VRAFSYLFWQLLAWTPGCHFGNNVSARTDGMRVILAVVCLSFAAVACGDEGYRELFNGRDLTGWIGDGGIWSVEDGLLTGQTKSAEELSHNTFATWTGGVLEDFDLRLEFRVQGDNNSGVQYRSRRAQDVSPWSIVGYQADLHSAPNYSGMLYDEGGRGILAERGQSVHVGAKGEKTVKTIEADPKSVDLTDWNVLEISARGNRLVHKLNGEVTVEAVDKDAENADLKGLLALQVHRGPAMKVQFRSIKLRTLPATRASAANGASRFDATATPPERIRVPKGFQVELLYSIPKESQGSWVNLCTDPKGRLIVSDQYGGLYRVTVPESGSKQQVNVEPIPVELGQAHGLLWAFDSLYVVVNGNREQYDNGLYRVRDTNADDQLDSVELLRPLNGDGEHGPHAVLLAPDGESLFVVCGNNTKLVDLSRSRVPQIWDEDRLLPRIYGVGFMRGYGAPAGCIYRVDRDGREWELVSSGFRNEFDAAVNADGELFTFDADMEYDLGTAWYRPTRVCHVVSGADWGWRVSSAKWPVHFADTLPPVVDIGLSSPTGITFGYGAKFPANYQRALFLCDWTYGRMYAVQLQPHGSSYTGAAEEFMSASPLPLTDVVIRPQDGAMYFLIGGRDTQSGLYRVSYVGSEPVSKVEAASNNAAQRAERHRLEELHLGSHSQAADVAWPSLGHSDRFVRHAARTALEHVPLERWSDRALTEQDPQRALTALLALVRKVPRSYKPTGADLDTPAPAYPAVDADRHSLHGPVLTALGRLEWSSLTVDQRLELIRVYTLALYRLGPPDEAMRATLIARLDSLYPAADSRLNSMLTELLCFLQADSAAVKGVALLTSAPTQEEQIDLARSLCHLRNGWTDEARRQFFEWVRKAETYKGGVNFVTFIKEIKAEAVKGLSENQKLALADILEAPPLDPSGLLSKEPRSFVKEWTLEEALPLVEAGLKRRSFEKGRELFAAARCFDCHRFANEGGAVGPYLTGLAGRFSPRDLLESILHPDKVISDQYAGVQILTSTGKVVVGRITNFDGDEIHINTNMADPTALEIVLRPEIEELRPSTVSMMPSGLLNTLNEQELLDLMAFLLSRGNPDDPAFAP
jgi:putative heme-binding domain-containing protein